MDKAIEAIARALCLADDPDQIGTTGSCEGGCVHPAVGSVCPYREQARAAYLETLRQIRDNHSTGAIVAFYQAYERALSPDQWESPFSNGLEAFIDHLISEAGSE